MSEQITDIKINELLERIKETKEEYGKNFPWKWDNLKQINVKDGSYIYVPQGSFLGNTLINLNDNYGNSGFDCLLIEDALKYLEPLLLEVKESRERIDKITQNLKDFG